jgi:hypothetical protein
MRRLGVRPRIRSPASLGTDTVVVGARGSRLAQAMVTEFLARLGGGEVQEPSCDDAGQALADLAPTGYSTTKAAGRLSTAIAGHGLAFARVKILAEVKLAALTMITGDPV